MLALSVIYTHTFVITALPAGPDIFTAITHGHLYIAAVGVDFFFLISGFLITASWLQHANLSTFLLNRILRIYPAFIVVSLLSALILGPLGAADPSAYWAAFRPFAFLSGVLSLAQLAVPSTFQSSPYPNELNGSLWTIKIEFEYYLVVAVFGVLGLLRRRWIALAVLVVLLVAFALRDFWPASAARFDQHVRFGTFFLAGMCFYLYRDVVRHSLAMFLVSLVLAAAALFFTPAASAGLAVFGGYCLLYIAFAPWLRLHHFARRADLSYGVYLYAWPVELVLVRFMAPSAINPYVLFGLVCVLTCGVAALSWACIEGPALRLKRATGAIRFASRAPLSLSPSVLGAGHTAGQVPAQTPPGA